MELMQIQDNEHNNNAVRRSKNNDDGNGITRACGRIHGDNCQMASGTAIADILTIAGMNQAKESDDVIFSLIYECGCKRRRCGY
jgi:hypothetical protein